MRGKSEQQEFAVVHVGPVATRLVKRIRETMTSETVPDNSDDLDVENEGNTVLQFRWCATIHDVHARSWTFTNVETLTLTCQTVSG